MKTIYLVRHGQSVGNAANILIDKDGPLSELGLNQALVVAERFTHIEIDKLFASDFLRAQQTAQPISKLKNIPVVVNQVFGEFREPSSFVGQAEDTEELLAYRKERNSKAASNPDWTYGDGESVTIFMDRINRARILLESSSEETIAVVSHAYFITSLIAAILLEAETPSKDWFTVMKNLSLTNTGISVLKFGDGQWRVSTFNDQAHFAE